MLTALMSLAMRVKPDVGNKWPMKPACLLGIMSKTLQNLPISSVLGRETKFLAMASKASAGLLLLSPDSLFPNPSGLPAPPEHFALPFPSALLLFSRSVMSNSLQTPWTTVCQVSLSFTISWSLLKLMSIESAIPSNHLVFCHPLLLLPSIFPSIRVFSNELALYIRWPKYWSFSNSPSNEYSRLSSFIIDWFDLLAVQGTLKRLLQYHSSKASILQCFSSKDQVSFNFMAAVTICSDFGAQENKICHCLHCFPIYLP